MRKVTCNPTCFFVFYLIGYIKKLANTNYILVEGFAAGKTVGLFGSYGWGDGQWMRDWEERMKAAGAEVACGEGVITQETPDDDALAKCKELGKTLAAV